MCISSDNRNIILDVYGNPRPYCASTESDPKDNQAVATDDLVYRPSTAKWAKQGEPIPCELNQTSAKLAPRKNPPSADEIGEAQERTKK